MEQLSLLLFVEGATHDKGSQYVVTLRNTKEKRTWEGRKQGGKRGIVQKIT